jgi:phage protein
MKNNALSVANFFIDLAQRDSKSLTQLGLMKRVYIAHGFSLAVRGESLLDDRFDKVEAWKYGPVIPSVYHSFKHFKANPIKDKTIIGKWNSQKSEFEFETPVLKDKGAQDIVEMVWNRYSDFSDSEMVKLTHKPGTPWSVCYAENQNNEIPDDITRLYYGRIVDSVISKSGNNGQAENS